MADKKVLSYKEWMDTLTQSNLANWSLSNSLESKYKAYLNALGDVAPEQLDTAQGFAEKAGAETLLESVGQDIAARDVGKRKLRERQTSRQASMVGRIAPRSQQQTASLLSSATPATGTTLLG